MSTPRRISEISSPGPWDAKVVSVLVVALAVGCYLRLAGLSQMLFFGDEFLSLCNYRLPWGELALTYDQNGTGVPLPLLQKASAAIFGANELTLRLPALVPGILAIPVAFFFFRPFFEPFVAALGTVLFAVSHYAIFYSTHGRIYSLYLLLSMLGVILLIKMTHHPERWPATLFALLGGWIVFCHLSGAAFLAICAAYAAWVLRSRRAARREWWICSLAFLGSGVVAFCLYLPTLSTVLSFLTTKAQLGTGPGVNFVRMLEIYAGGSANAILFAVLGSLGLIAAIAKRRPHRWLAPWMLAGASVLLILVDPIGFPIAHARYAIYLFPFLLVSVVDGLLLVSGALASVIRTRQRTVTFGISILLFSAIYWAMGFERSSIDRGASFDSSRSIGFSEVDAPIPAVYRELRSEEECGRVIEFPFFNIRQRASAQLLYMRYGLVHRKEVYIGEAVDTGAMNRYINVLDIPTEFGGNTCVVFHKTIAEEVRHWSEARLLQRRGQVVRLPRTDPQIMPACWFGDETTIYDMDGILDDLRTRLGPAWREDESVAVFRVPARD